MVYAALKVGWETSSMLSHYKRLHQTPLIKPNNYTEFIMMDENTRQRIQTEVDTNDVLLFMKGTVFPQCGFSAAVIQVLSHLQLNSTA